MILAIFLADRITFGNWVAFCDSCILVGVSSTSLTIEPWQQIVVKDALATSKCHRFPIMTIAFEEQLAEIVKPALLWRDQFMTATRFTSPII